MRVVIDTNVFVSSFFGGNPRKIIDLWKQEQITLCLSQAILDEYVEVLQRIGLKNESELRELLTLLSTGFNLHFIRKTPRIKIVKNDPDDDKFLECAVALNADVIITGDSALKAVREYKGVHILTPLQFLKTYKIR